jgi:hypothetical protein
MAASDDHPTIRNLGTVYGASAEGLRFMHRRRVGTADRNGDPLDGIVNLFDVALVLAVGFLVAALSAAGITGLLTQENMTIVTNPGAANMQVIVKEGDKIEQLDIQSGAQVEGVGTLIGSFYKLADGTVVYVPTGTTPPQNSAPVPGTPAPTPSVSTSSAPTHESPTPLPTTNTQPTTPAPGVGLTPTDSAVPRGGQ